MFRVSYFVFFIISYVLLLALAHKENNFDKRCPPFNCGVLGPIGFPFSNETHPECGFLKVHCGGQVPRIQLGEHGPQFYVTSISKHNMLALQDKPGFENPLDNRSCVESLKHVTIPSSPFISFEPLPKNQTLFQCPGMAYSVPVNYTPLCNDSKHSIFYYNGSNHGGSPTPPQQCSLILFQMSKTQKGVDFFNLYTGWFRIQVNVKRECRDCHNRGGRCQIDTKGNFNCANATRRGNENLKLKLSVGLGIGIGASTVLIIWFIWCRKKQKYTYPSFHSRYTTSDPSSNSELEVGNVYVGVPVLSYGELAEATNNFNQQNELGNGGFGAVYYARLRDGREVAVKRLYEHNYRRLEHFMNEVEILTRLRHKNLVSLYGCTSRHSQRGLLLVYEYIPNGTLADHLHGGRAKPCSLTWPIRLNIAIETASALAYLHASEIIHRDVKADNILLDSNFCVKVADFGLSRLFPTDVTHVSTAPQGSPGYVDPEYHKCYQLTDKSDVYSFGVVLIELISSMPAVDMNRHRDEINLADLAMNRIQNAAIDELIDPCLGYQSDEEVRRMTTLAAGVAFLCLQQNREMRPSMHVVLEELKRIKSGEFNPANPIEKHDDNAVLKSMKPPFSSPDCDEDAKNFRLSPISVTANWVGSDTTSNASS